MINRDFSSTGLCLGKKRDVLFVSGTVNRAFDWNTGKRIAAFGHVESAYPSLSPQGDFLALSSRYKGIEIVDASSFQTVYRHTPNGRPGDCYSQSFWISDTKLLFCVSTSLYAVDIAGPQKAEEIMRLDYSSFPVCDQDEKMEGMFVQSMDAHRQTVLMNISRFSRWLNVLVQIDLQSVRLEYKQINNSYSGVFLDKKGGYYLLGPLGSLFHFDSLSSQVEYHHDPYSDQNDQLIENRKHQLPMDAYDIAVSPSGELIAATRYPYEMEVMLYNVIDLNPVRKIPLRSALSSLRFSEDGCYLFVSGRRTVISEVFV